MKKTLTFSITTILMSLVLLIFIKQTNDHKECETKTQIAYGNNGEKIVSERHTCKEKFNL